MSVEILCRIGYLGGTPRLPRYTLHQQAIRDYFAAASVTPTGASDISLALDTGDVVEFADARRTATSFDLHRALGLLRDRPSTVEPRNRIGILFAGRYAPRAGALGMMFDRGFAVPGEDPDGDDAPYSVPRQGCAVFLDRIAELRAPGHTWDSLAASGQPAADLQAMIEESVFTAIHELGHVFNLKHAPVDGFGANFMAGSDIAPRPPCFFEFIDVHRAMLAHCSSWDDVHPGGTPFGSHNVEDAESAVSKSSVRIRPSKRRLPLTLGVELARDRVFPFEPVELDVTLALADGQPAVSVPDEIDPGYGRFRIWIEDPVGERRLYRSPRHYCSSAATLRIETREPFSRDISLFGEAGGYTFHRFGEHQVWAELRLPDGRWLESNHQPLEIRGPDRDWERRRLLLDRSIARALYYRLAHPRSRAIRLLRGFADEHPRDPNVGAILYTLGRVHAHHAEDRRLRASSRRVHATAARELLKRARDRRALGKRARAIATEKLEKLDS